MRSTRQGPVAPKGGESLTLQQVMEMMQALQEEMVTSRANQECIQADLAASRETNEELHLSNEELRRDLQNQAGGREEGDREPAMPPREFPMPFSQEIMDAVIPAMFVGPKVTFTGTEDPEAHLTTLHTQMMLVGGSEAVRCKLFMTTLVGIAMDWFISLPDGHVMSFPQLTKLQCGQLLLQCGQLLFSLAEASQLLLQCGLAGNKRTSQQGRFFLSFSLYQRHPRLSPSYESIGLSKESPKVETQSFPRSGLIRVHRHL